MEVKALAACSLTLQAPSSAPSVAARYGSPSASSPSCSLPFARSIAIRCVLGNTSVPRSSSSSRTWRCPLHLLPSFSKAAVAVARRAQTENAFVDVQVEEEESHPNWGNKAVKEEMAAEHFGEVDLIVASRLEDRKTQYLILWKDDHPDSWEPADNIAKDVVAEYEKPWWDAARKADVEKLKELLDNEELQRDVNAIDENERTALLFAAGLGSEKCARLLIDYGADLHWQEKDGFTALHIASGYVHVNTVKALVELGADPDLEDANGRSALSLAQELLRKTPRANPLQFARRMALDQVVKALDEVMYETVEVEQVLDKRIGEGGLVEYLVKWNDDTENGWISAMDIGEDLIKDYEDGLEYGIVEKVLDKREADGKVEYFVKWADGAETWETEENVGDEVVAEYNSSQIPQ